MIFSSLQSKYVFVLLCILILAPLYFIYLKLNVSSIPYGALNFKTYDYLIKHKSEILKPPSTLLMNTILKNQITTSHYICINLIGRLGNRMFVFASALGLAKFKNMNLVVYNGKDSLQDIFNLYNIETNKTLCTNAKSKYQRHACSFDPSLFNISNQTNVFVGEYLQSYKYFEHISDEIRSQFTFKKAIKEKAVRILKNFVENHKKTNIHASMNWTVVGIHARRGDMVNHKHGYNVATKDYFIKAKEWFRSHYKNVIFVVCSNDVRWCESNLSDNSTYFVKDNSAEEDMAVLTSCDHLISSVGSYSWWSGFLSKGNVTYYFPPVKENSILRNEFSVDYMDYFLPQWIRL